MTKERNREDDRFPETAPSACSTIFRWTVEDASFQFTFTVPSGHTTMQSAHPMHDSGEIAAFDATTTIAPDGQWATQVPHPVHPEGSTAGDTEECWESFPERDAQPIPRFFSVPPNPQSSCPLKCVTTTIASAWAISAPIGTSRKIFPAIGTRTALSPRSPSATTRGAPATAQAKPFVIAVFK